ncbi:MAG: zinc-ribbon domain-containing protein, partial [Bacteroidaceae bacterium]|nr:zinc-ribbon domain-containing protein [Bacteroidaceae bacterium]
VCPFCKTEIKEGDAVKVCPSCGRPHHESCWEENKGCTKFGCSGQHYEEQYVSSADVCINCGAPLGDDQEFCPKCGTPKGCFPKNVCSKCCAELEDGQAFCAKCGQKVELRIDASENFGILHLDDGVGKVNDKVRMRGKTIGIIVAILAVVCVLAILFLPKIFVSVDDLCAQGNYEKAYAKASVDERMKIRAENAVAVQSSFSAENLKDPSSFELKNAYYKEGKNDDGTDSKQLVLTIRGANSFGGKATNYWLYLWDDDGNEWEYRGAVADLSAEEASKYDDEDESREKILNNLVRLVIQKTMDEGITLGKDAVERINVLYEEGVLDDVKLLGIE